MERSKSYAAGRALAWEDTRYLFNDELTLAEVMKFLDAKCLWLSIAWRGVEADDDADFLSGYEECLEQRAKARASQVFDLPEAE